MANPRVSHTGTTTGARARERLGALPRIALLLPVLATVFAVMAALAGFGSRWEWWTFRTGFTLLRYAAYGGIAVALLSVIAAVALVRTRPVGWRRSMPGVLVGLVIGLLLVAIPWQWQARARSVPPIHDISTDTDNPPEFVAVAPLRSNAPNPIEYGGTQVAAQQRNAYPDIRPLLLNLPMERAFERALGAALEMGWEIVDSDTVAGRIEATDQTFWFGFKDDVVIRLAAVGGRTVLDVRSLSRVGGGDAGTNARRIREYLAAVREGGQ